MKRNWMYVLLILLAGMAGAVLRAMSLLYGYEPESGLPIDGYVPAMVLIGLTAVVFVLVLLLCRGWFRKLNGCRFEDLFGEMPGSMRAAGTLFGACVLASGGFGISLLSDEVAEQSNEFVSAGTMTTVAIVVMWTLCLLSGVMMILLLRGQRDGHPATKQMGTMITLPMFWCCMDLIMIYHENSGNPVISDYSYTLLMVIAIMTAFYSMGGFFFENSPAVRFFASSGIAVYLVLTYAGGAVLSFLMGSTPQNWLYADLIRLGAYLSVGAYLLVQMLHALGRTTQAAEAVRHSAIDNTEQKID